MGGLGAMFGFRSVRVRFGPIMGVMLGKSWADAERETASHLYKHNGPRLCAGGHSHGLCQATVVPHGARLAVRHLSLGQGRGGYRITVPPHT